MSWFYLLAAGLAEIIFASSLKYTEGFTRLWPSMISLLAGSASFYMLTLALKQVPLGTAYAIWTGMGAVGVAIVGIVVFKESYNWSTILSLSLVILGIVGLRLSALT